MSLVALASAKGSPGVSTATLAMALTWPEGRGAVIVEADPAGSVLAPRFGLPYEPGVTTLAPVSRRSFHPPALAEHLQRLPTRSGDRAASALVGVRSAEQGRLLGRFWADFADAMAVEPGPDLLVDCGRLDPDSPAMEIVRQAELTLLFTRPDVENVLQTRLRLGALADSGAAQGATTVVVVGRRPHSPAAVREALEADVLGVLAYDPRSAAALSGEPGELRRRFRRQSLLPSAQALCTALERRLSPPSPAAAFGATQVRMPELPSAPVTVLRGDQHGR